GGAAYVGGRVGPVAHILEARVPAVDSERASGARDLQAPVHLTSESVRHGGERKREVEGEPERSNRRDGAAESGEPDTRAAGRRLDPRSPPPSIDRSER